MSKSLSSPTASLLRSSRLFSLPRPLPQPSLETVTAQGILRVSDTATLPHPTHQSIVAPASSQGRGDYGLKRPLPQKSTRRAHSGVRVRAVDTYTHITDFESAGDHGMAIQKWQQMGIPMIKKAERNRASQTNDRQIHSVYEEEKDNTDPDSIRGPSGADKSRWKFDGPWVAGLQDGEFERLIDTRFATPENREKWRNALRERLILKKALTARRQAMDQGELDTFTAKVSDFKVTEAEIQEEEKSLRDEHAALGDKSLTSQLTQLIVKHLDLPAIRNAEFDGNAAIVAAAGVDAISGPPTTHPGAGLSYIRSNALMDNHPIHGPQAYRSPVIARVLKTRGTAAKGDSRAQLGVGGFVTTDSVASSWASEGQRARAIANVTKDEYDPERMANTVDLDLEGGNKIWVHPEQASMDEKSRVRIDAARADKEALAVKTGETDKIEEQRRPYGNILGGIGGMPNLWNPTAASAATASRPQANYGTALPNRAAAQSQRRDDSGPGQRRSQITGLDAELDGTANSQDYAERIRQIYEGSR